MSNDLKFLQTILKREDTILFIGSGLSLWSGLPTWTGLIEELAKFVEKLGYSSNIVRSEAKKGDLLQAASYGFAKLTPLQIGEFVRAACRSGKSAPHTIHEKLVLLGPRCFVTTNYDDLLEQSLRTCRPDIKFGTSVTNKNLTAIADLIQARRTDFIYKPHGDAYDADSIILTREQYRKLLPQGERHTALDALKTLMITRPVVYFGFGLRDPDFLYLRDIIANVYTGGNIDHYAIMADVEEEERLYWHKTFGLHLVNYSTVEKENGKRDHSPLLKLIEQLAETPDEKPPINAPSESDLWLSLARYAAGLGRRWTLHPDNELSVNVEERKQQRKTDIRLAPAATISVDEFLQRDAEKAILLGAPGAGKSHSFARCVKILANDLQSACLSAEHNKKNTRIPIYCDLKLYEGDLLHLIAKQLPPNITIQYLIDNFSVRIYMDSFNEMPIEFREGQNFQDDFLKSFNILEGSSIYICSRNSDGLQEFGFPQYELADYEYDEVVKYIDVNQIAISSLHRDDFINILRRPYYFNLFKDGKVSFSGSAHPIELYASLLKSIEARFQSRFHEKTGLMEMLSTVAAAALDSGQEAFDAETFLHYSKWLADLISISPEDILNWLISERFIITYPGNRISFAHQSITEFLAANYLSELYKRNQDVLDHKLQFSRWNQALFLCTGILTSDEAVKFVDNIIQKDVLLAIRSVRYIEYGRSEIVKQIIEFLKHAQLPQTQLMQVNWAIQHNLPAELSHVGELQDLIDQMPDLGGGAARLLIQIDPVETKDRLLHYFIEKPTSFNLLVNGIAPALVPLIDKHDLANVGFWCDQLEKEHGLAQAIALNGFSSGIRALCVNLSPDELRNLILPNENDIRRPSMRRYVLSAAIEYRHSTEALKLAAELLANGEAAAAYCVHSNATRSDKVDWYFFTTNHVDRLLESFFISGHWAYSALGDVCRARPDLSAYVVSQSKMASGIKKAAMLMAAGFDQRSAFQPLLELRNSPNNNETLIAEVGILSRLELDWGGNEELLIDLIKMRNKYLSYSILGGSHPPKLGQISKLEIGDLAWWLEWMADLENESHWLIQQLGWIIGRNSEKVEIIQQLYVLMESNQLHSILLARHILPFVPDLVLEDFSASATDYLLMAAASGILPLGFSGNILTKIANEKFTVERIVPLLGKSSGASRNIIIQVLRQIGSRLGRRFVGDDGVILNGEL